MNNGNEQVKEFLHSWYLLLMSLFSLGFLMVNSRFLFNIPVVVFLLYMYFKNGLSTSIFKKFLLYAFVFSFGFFVLKIIYPAQNLKMGNNFQVFNFVIYQDVLKASGLSMGKLFLVSLLSMSSGAVINYTKVVLYLIVHKGLKLFWGYPILLALNSIVLFKEEFERIQINVRMRNLPFKDKISLFFPLLVFAIRHSQRGALALVTRGLNNQKTFYFSYDVRKTDRDKIQLFFIMYIILVGATLYFH